MINEYRVLNMCKKCDVVYNGTKAMSRADAVRWHFNTMIRLNETCRKEGCSELIVPIIEKIGGKDD